MEEIFRPTTEQRKKLKQPYGKVVENVDEAREFIENCNQGKLILVGDRVSLDLNYMDPDISIVDGRIERGKIPQEMIDEIRGFTIEAKNLRGSITEAGWNSVKEAFARQEKVKILIDGEEDLLAIPVVYFAPPNSIVAYGLKGEGCVLADVDEKLKGKIYEFVDRRDFEEVIVGGSWAYLHPGQRYLLFTAFERGEKVLIGVTSDQMMQEKVEQGYEHMAYGERVGELRNFLRRYGLLDRCEIVEIEDFKGDAVERGDAIVVSEETYDNAVKINKIREGRGKKSLEILKVSTIRDENGHPYASRKIRRSRQDS